MGLDVAPLSVNIAKPEYFFENVRWTHKFDNEEHPHYLENFFLSPAKIEFKGKTYKALLYVPDPSTKPGHFHPPTTIEVIAQKIPDIGYGDSVTLCYNPVAIDLIKPAEERL